MSASLRSSNVSEEALASPPDASHTHEHDHFVQFYDSDSYLTESVRDFVVGGLRNGEDTVVVAPQAHREQLEVALEEVGVDVRAARSEGRYRSFDAAATLSEFIIDGDPDPHLFEKLIGGMIPHASEDGRALRVFGEMVTLLWDEGNIPRGDPAGGVLELELGGSTLCPDVRLTHAQLQSRGRYGAIQRGVRPA